MSLAILIRFAPWITAGAVILVLWVALKSVRADLVETNEARQKAVSSFTVCDASIKAQNKQIAELSEQSEAEQSERVRLLENLQDERITRETFQHRLQKRNRKLMQAIDCDAEPYPDNSLLNDSIAAANSGN